MHLLNYIQYAKYFKSVSHPFHYGFLNDYFAASRVPVKINEKRLVNEQWEFQLKHKIWADECPHLWKRSIISFLIGIIIKLLSLHSVSYIICIIIFLIYTSLYSISLHHESLITDFLIPYTLHTFFPWLFFAPLRLHPILCTSL